MAGKGIGGGWEGDGRGMGGGWEGDGRGMGGGRKEASLIIQAHSSPFALFP